ncbi:hypothetical protein BLNAU_559 [Blattamonas nauphoetae]|uniref:FHA domain-containing protein n=1 Tax=Blattamonas nauphoetae TaxID=2049346 RepID=A0ABQ9YLL6_9EUKA|nr:hypothetical protein BLNAU_559 [Blattamonas nauphoetae]
MFSNVTLDGEITGEENEPSYVQDLRQMVQDLMVKVSTLEHIVEKQQSDITTLSALRPLVKVSHKFSNLHLVTPVVDLGKRAIVSIFANNKFNERVPASAALNKNQFVVRVSRINISPTGEKIGNALPVRFNMYSREEARDAQIDITSDNVSGAHFFISFDMEQSGTYRVTYHDPSNITPSQSPFLTGQSSHLHIQNSPLLIRNGFHFCEEKTNQEILLTEEALVATCNHPRPTFRFALGNTDLSCGQWMWRVIVDKIQEGSPMLIGLCDPAEVQNGTSLSQTKGAIVVDIVSLMVHINGLPFRLFRHFEKYKIEQGSRIDFYLDNDQHTLMLSINDNDAKIVRLEADNWPASIVAAVELYKKGDSVRFDFPLPQAHFSTEDNEEDLLTVIDGQDVHVLASETTLLKPVPISFSHP